jgi:probable phosphoglycerate mutase
MSADLRLYLIRHGETEWSLSGQHTGRSDIPLTGHGEDEARALAPCLRDIPFAHVLTSPRQRARRTCELAGLGTAAEIESDLAEWDYGDYEGQRSVDICKRRPSWMVFRDGCPEGEMPAQVAGRADRIIARLGAMRGNIAVFSHGQFSCVLAARWIGLPIIEARHFSLGPASLSVLGYNPDHPEVAVIALWNAGPAALPGGRQTSQ